MSLILVCMFIILLHLCITGSCKKIEASIGDFISQEKKSLDKLVKCPLNKLTKNAVFNLWLQDKVSDVTSLCLLKVLEGNINDHWSWTLLGTTFDLKNEHQKGDACFKQSAKIAGKFNSFISEWHVLGPFSIGKTEFDGDPLAAYGGIRNISKFRLSSQPSYKYSSELVAGGEISWSVVNNVDEMVAVRPKVDWNDLVSSLGSLGITEWQGWAVGDMFINEDSTVLNFRCLGVARCYVDQILIAGDLYHRAHFWFPVALTRGTHTLYIPLRFKVNANFKFSLTKSANFKISDPPFLPDLQNGYLPNNAFIPVPVSNHMAKKWLKIFSVKVEKQSKGATLTARLVQTFNSVAPGQTKITVVNLELKDSTLGGLLISPCTDIELELKIVTSEGSDQLPVVLRCRRKKSSFLFTFMDHDGSIQHAAAVEPLGTCPDKICPVFLTLHGTTVPPQNQADSYKKMVRGEYEFGITKMWLLAPTRHGAHNWEGPGALTAMTALQALHTMTQSSDWLEMMADPTKVLFAGHSMGGHGAWHLATHFPDRAIGLISLAGWIKKEEYGDSNLFFRHDIATSHTDPAVKAIMEACIAENDADKHVTNLKGIPVLARIGTNDRTVHPYFVRRMLRLLKESEIDVTYTELPNLEHWWWDTKETNDGGCVNDAQIRSFISKVSDSLAPSEFCSSVVEEDDLPCSAEILSTEHKLVKLVTVNPAFGEGLCGVVILQQQVPFRTSTVEINATKHELKLVTQNVQCLHFKEELSNEGKQQKGFKSLTIDGQLFDMACQTFPHTYCLKHEDTGSIQWVRRDDWHNAAESGLERGPHNYGPARRVAEHQFIIIVGTQSSVLVSDVLLQHAVYLANQFLLLSDTVVPILEDRNVAQEQMDDYNLIILGTPDENSLTGGYLDFLPDLHFVWNSEDHNKSLRLGERCHHTSPHVGLLSLAPHGQGLAMILMGLSLEGLEDVITLATPTIPPMARSPFSNLLPDFVITGPDVRLKGPGGFLCVGFWDNHWRLLPSSTSCVC